MMGIPYNTKKPYKKLGECHECGEKFAKSDTIKSGKVVQLKLYDDPWQDEPNIVRVHAHNDDGHGDCLDKLTDTSWADFRYFTCEKCDRLVISQCPYNGWRSYIKETDDGREICVRCYQEDILENGHDVEIFKSGRVPGDFFSEKEISNLNWGLVSGQNYKHIAGRDSAGELCKLALKLIGEGRKVLINYETMAQGGGEGYVSMYYK